MPSVPRFDESPRADLGLAVAAGLFGAAGVALSAVAAHRVADPALVTAAQFLLMHGVAVLAVSGWAVRSPTQGGWWRVAARLLLLGTALFCGDIAARTFLGSRLFPMAAPLGGFTMIAGWIMVALAAARDWRALGRT